MIQVERIMTMIDLNILKNQKKEIAILGHKSADFDSIVSGYLLQYILSALNIPARFVLQDRFADPLFIEIANKLGFAYQWSYELNDDDVIFLVDHTDAYPQTVIGCFDHHPAVVPVETNYVNQPKTSCAKLIYDWAEELCLAIPDALTLLTVYACYLDSLSFKSTKALPEDKLWCQKQIQKFGLNEKELVRYGYGITDRSLPYSDYLKNGIKSYTINGKTVNSSYAVVEDNSDDSDLARKYFLNELTDDIIAWCYIQSNVANDTTRIMLVTKDFTLTQTVNRLLSRGKNIIPSVFSFLAFENNGTLTKTLIENNLQISTMESCTCGLIASTITDYEGASAILKGSSITYSNEAKVMAGVPSEIISDFGVYSKETAEAMASHTKQTFGSDIAIGVTGSFSNVDPNNADSVAGVIYYHILCGDTVTPVKLTYHQLDISRKEIKQKTVDIVLGTLYAILSR